MSYIADKVIQEGRADIVDALINLKVTLAPYNKSVKDVLQAQLDRMKDPLLWLTKAGEVEDLTKIAKEREEALVQANETISLLFREFLLVETKQSDVKEG